MRLSGSAGLPGGRQQTVQILRGEETGLAAGPEPGALAFGIGAGVVQPEAAAFLQGKFAAQMGQHFGAADAGPAGGRGIVAALPGGAGLVHAMFSVSFVITVEEQEKLLEGVWFDTMTDVFHYLESFSS